MPKREYLVQGSFNFNADGYSPGAIHDSLVNIFKKNGFSVVDFEISVSRVIEEEKDALITGGDEQNEKNSTRKTDYVRKRNNHKFQPRRKKG
jgi:hypothetical protein